ncbi:transposase [Amycolatopsis sp. NPDC026612]|uniref:transposase n=1 Tax=Amycolatopsis sp. NPDC026612 TaxID=3155466 RepID=UPI0033CB2950
MAIGKGGQSGRRPPSDSAASRGHRGRLELFAIGPPGAARLRGDIGDVGRFADKGRFPPWNGTAPSGASSGDRRRHRPLSSALTTPRSRLLPAEAGRGQDQDASDAVPETPAVVCRRMPRDAERVAAGSGGHSWAAPD